jgi:gluconokinase
MPDFLAQAAEVEAGSGGLIFLPYILGERAPMWDAAARGLFFGLTINHTRAHIVRAAMEGVVFCVYAIGKSILEKREIRQIDVTGGFAQSDLWVQILSDVFSLPVKVSETIENAAWGAVKVGVEALGISLRTEERILKVFNPSLETHLLYQKEFIKLERLYMLLKGEF